MCEQCHIAFIGPSAEVIRRMGNKQEARNTMINAKVPVIPGTKEAVYTADYGLKLAEQIGFPVMIKAASGGGGKGMRISHSREDFTENFEVAQTESVNGFADDTMYIEKYIEDPRHIEFQILADKYGNVISLGERDCSIQRRHQKMGRRVTIRSTGRINSVPRWEKWQSAQQKQQTMRAAGTIDFY